MVECVLREESAVKDRSKGKDGKKHRKKKDKSKLNPVAKSQTGNPGLGL